MADPYANLHMPGVCTMTPAEAKTQRNKLVPEVLKQWTTLRDIILRHEATIQNRWVRKSKPKRRAVLSEAWPDMPKEHQADVAAWKRKSKDTIVDSANADAYLMPYMNLEDLSKTEPLPLLLNSRGRNPPNAFAHSDVAAYRVGLITRSIDRPFLKEWVMMFNGQTTPETYGKLYHWDDHPDAFFWSMEVRGLLPGDGLNCLKIQERIYSFLVKCCLIILHDIPRDDITGPAYPEVEEPPRLSANNTETGTTSLTVTSFESSYRLPSRLDLDRLESVVTAQVAELEDEIWNLRDDPEAFANAVLEIKEHRQEMLLDSNGKTHPVLDPIRMHTFWQRVISSLVVDKFVALGVWHVVLEKVQKLRRLMDKHKSRLDPAQDLPEELAMAFYELWTVLERMEVGPVSTLKISFPGSPPMRSHFEREPPPNPHTPKIILHSKNITRSKAEQDFLATIRMLWDDEERRLLTTHTLLDSIDHLIQKEPSVKALLTSYIREQLGQFALFSECLHQLKLFQPWADRFEDKIVKVQAEIDRDFVARTKWMGHISQMSYGQGFVELGIPTDGRFRYPAGKKPTRENVEQMRSAEAALDQFWAAFLQTYEHTLSPCLVDILVRRERHRTGPYVEPVKKGSAKESDASLGAPFGGLKIDEQKVAPTAPKTKVKTKGVAAPEADSSSSPAPQAPAESEATFQVDKRAIKVFNALFFSNDLAQQSGSGETNWTDFVYAMTQTGFSAEKIYGSVWHFEPSKLDEKKSIQVHEPHPSSKIPFWLARRIGRRLSRTYGWDRSMFVES